jgi:hypothetical protein
VLRITGLPGTAFHHIAHPFGLKRSEIVVEQQGAAGEQQEHRVPGRAQGAGGERLPNSKQPSQPNVSRTEAFHGATWMQGRTDVLAAERMRIRCRWRCSPGARGATFR